MKRLLFLILPLFLWSCADEVQLQEMTEKERFKAEETAAIIQNSFLNSEPEVIASMFDPIKFSNRVRIPGLRPNEKPPSILLEMIQANFDEQIAILTSYKSELGCHMQLLHIHKKNDVVRLTYSLKDKYDNETFSYYVFYISINNLGDYEIVNLYNPYAGLSLGQIFNQFASRYGNGSRKFFQELLDTDRIAKEAEVLIAQNENLKAYELLKTIDSKHSVVHKYALLKLKLSESLNNELYIEELENMKMLSPNSQSDLLYDCIIKGLKEENEETYQGCIMELQQLLFTT